MRKISCGLLALLAFSSQANAQALPANLIGNVLADGVVQTLIARGFAANDPRILSTVQAISVDAVSVSASAGAGGTWLGTMGSLSPVVLTGIAVGAGLIWYFGNNGLTYLAPPGSTTSNPVFSNGTVVSSPCWFITGGGCFGSPQESLSYLFSLTVAMYPTASYGVPSLTQNSSTQYTATYNYSIPPLYLNNSSGSKVITSMTATLACPAGSGYVTTAGGCVSAKLSASPYAGAPVVGVSLAVADANLPSNVQNAAITPDVLAELLNRVWKDAAGKTNYPGVPWSAARPTVSTDFTPYQNSNPSSAWPLTSGLTGTVPSTGITPNSSSPVNNPNASTPAASAPQVNLGTDPGITSPVLDAAPTGIFAPIQLLMSGWTNWSVPAHQGICPTWNVSPSISGHVFNINITEQCVLAEQYRAQIATAAMLSWIVIAVFIVLSA